MTGVRPGYQSKLDSIIRAIISQTITTIQLAPMIAFLVL
jgi:hypothetical protein